MPWPAIDEEVDVELSDAELFRTRYIAPGGGLTGIEDLWSDVPGYEKYMHSTYTSCLEAAVEVCLRYLAACKYLDPSSAWATWRADSG